MSLLGQVFTTSKETYYYYDTITNKLFQVGPWFYHNFEKIEKQLGKEEGISLLKKEAGEAERGEVEDFLEAFQRGMIGENKIKEIQYGFSLKEYLEALDQSLQHLILGVTEACNLRCEYCTYSGHYQYTRQHSSKTMRFETAVKAITFLKEHSSRSEQVAISFYGGEPFLCFSEIVKIVAFAEAQFHDKPHHYQITTNGTLLQEAFIPWFINQENVFINITLNGEESSHDRFRKYEDGRGSHKQIINNIKQLMKECPKEALNRVNFLCNYIDFSDLEKIMEFYEENTLLKGKIPLLINQVNPFDHDGFLEKYNAYEKEKEIQHKLVSKYLSELKTEQEENTFLKTFFDKKLYNIHMREMTRLEEKGAYFGLCIPFLTRVFVDTEGRFQLCEKVQLPYDFGNVFHGFKKEQIKELLEQYKRHNTDCKNCWAVRMCQACFYNTFTEEGVKEQRRQELCQSIKKNVLNHLRMYCEIMEQNENLLKHLEKYEFQS